MGHPAPRVITVPHRPPRQFPSRLDVARADYIAGRSDVGEFERRLEYLLASGKAEDPAPWARSSTIIRTR